MNKPSSTLTTHSPVKVTHASLVIRQTYHAHHADSQGHRGRVLRIKGKVSNEVKGQRAAWKKEENIGKQRERKDTEDREQDVQSLWAPDHCGKLGRAGAQGEGRATGADRRETECVHAMACSVTPNPCPENVISIVLFSAGRQETARMLE